MFFFIIIYTDLHWNEKEEEWVNSSRKQSSALRDWKSVEGKIGRQE